jgi:hypothetical protein
MILTKYAIVKEKNLLLQRFIGEIRYNDLINFFTVLYEDPDYLEVRKIYSDFSKAVVALTLEELEGVALFIINHAPNQQVVANAIVVSEPLITAYSMVYQVVMDKMPNYTCQIFSTFDTAALHLGYKKIEIEGLMREHISV